MLVFMWYFVVCYVLWWKCIYLVDASLSISTPEHLKLVWPNLPDHCGNRTRDGKVFVLPIWGKFLNQCITVQLNYDNTPTSKTSKINGIFCEVIPSWSHLFNMEQPPSLTNLEKNRLNNHALHTVLALGLSKTKPQIRTEEWLTVAD